jgi:hypothetical protein
VGLYEGEAAQMSSIALPSPVQFVGDFAYFSLLKVTAAHEVRD